MNKSALASTTRVPWIDICRGIAILFVMYAHMLTSDSYRFVFYAFHMPLFFFLSGVVFKEKFPSFWTVVKKSFLTILVPYFLFAALTYLFWFAKEHTTHNTLVDFEYQLYGIFYGNGNNDYLYFNVALWFLPCLFITRVAFAALIRWTKSTKIILTSLIVFSIIGYIFATYFTSVKLFYGIETAFTAFVFFGAGFLLKRNENLLQKMQKNALLIFTSGLLLTVIFASCNYYLYGQQIDLRLNHINNYFYFYLGAFSGIFCWVACSMMIGKSYLLQYIGKHTLVLFAWHYLLYGYFSDFANFILSDDTIDHIQSFIPLLFTFLAVLLILLGTKLVQEMKLNYIYPIVKRK